MAVAKTVHDTQLLFDTRYQTLILVTRLCLLIPADAEPLNMGSFRRALEPVKFQLKFTLIPIT
ncbi:MAG: hypothetical protein EAZ60_07960 [Oscillatoriales cyanobacterium]|nr:MAG: hypothetical protein EAZ83_05435 [Oscillatoriales cyanobacterium]TAE93473.1 MAG: hypothetical protein EAZ79_27430 [Oscillatoriales cyanobacterium]TAF22551.1 MAG: hypothetical protein EAZ73_04880 [Oscillatoriales cyanobacterium]TAF37648.1 MAG: hypothetical protein EAZ69_06790 [Oscillatoriales cyanobacterium]TAF57105.1 MAG: hypothetical protein EAZ60_07960 [Oscillatoriales cyanobacterium]